MLVVFDELPVTSLMRADGASTTSGIRASGGSHGKERGTPHATPTTYTTHAVPAILTGTASGQRGSRRSRITHETSSRCSASRTRSSHEPVTRLCPPYCPRSRGRVAFGGRQRGLFYDTSVGYLHRILPRSIRGTLPPIGQRWSGFGEGSHVDPRELVLGALDKAAWNWALVEARGHENAQFEGFLRTVRATDRARTLYVEHALFPHTPWYFLPSGKRYGGTLLNGIEKSWTRWRSSQLLVDQALQRHKLQVGYTDRLLGRLMRRLERTGLYDRSLVIVTADHGASFKPGGYFRDVERANVGDIAAVPLFVKYPGQRRGRVDTRHAKTIDIAPTIADVVDVRMPWRVDGSSLRGPALERPVDIGTFRSGTMRVEREIVERGVSATARRNAALLGEGRDTIYRVGPHQELTGRRVSSFGRVATEGDGPVHGSDTLRAGSGLVGFRPVAHWRTIESDSVRAGTPLAIAVNGTVSGTTRALDDGSRLVFDVLVPETVFRERDNVVEPALFRIAPRGAGVSLRRLGATGRAARQTASRSG